MLWSQGDQIITGQAISYEYVIVQEQICDLYKGTYISLTFSPAIMPMKQQLFKRILVNLGCLNSSPYPCIIFFSYEAVKIYNTLCFEARNNREATQALVCKFSWVGILLFIVSDSWLSFAIWEMNDVKKNQNRFPQIWLEDSLEKGKGRFVEDRV